VNHLAHALVAHRTGTSITGNLMGDFVKGRPEDTLDGGLLEGVRLHRRVDAFTDDHPAFERCRARVRPELRRFAGILVDVWWDHVLARDWDEYGPEPLPRFARRVYADIALHRQALPPRMFRFVEYMVSTDLLVAYASPEGLARALYGMSQRMRRENPLAEGAAEFDRIAEGVAADFREFLPDLLEHAVAWMDNPEEEQR
jgi:acyl carrier protein phosphodiesterase